jgi:hypothetical protein
MATRASRSPSTCSLCSLTKPMAGTRAARKAASTWRFMAATAFRSTAGTPGRSSSVTATRRCGAAGPAAWVI